MDTRWKRFKYSTFNKIFCLLLTVALFFSSGFLTLALVSNVVADGSFESARGGHVPFEESAAFYRILRDDYWNAGEMLSYVDRETVQQAVNAQKTAILDDAVQMYWADRAAIIEGELKYVAAHEFDYETYYNTYGFRVFVEDGNATAYDGEEDVTEPSYEGDTIDDTVDGDAAEDRIDAGPFAGEITHRYDPETATKTETTTAAPATTAPTAEKSTAAEQTESATKDDVLWILANIKGTALNDFDYLVRDAAFQEKWFSYRADIPLPNGESVSIDLERNYATGDQTDLRQALDADFDRSCENYIDMMTHIVELGSEQLDSRVNLHVRVLNAEGKTVYDSMPHGWTPQQLAKNAVWLRWENGAFTQKGLDRYDVGAADYELLQQVTPLQSQWDANALKGTVYLYLDQPMKPGDLYFNLWIYRQSPVMKHFTLCAVLAGASLVLSILTLAIYLHLCGQKITEDGEELRLMWKDRLPLDVHVILSLVLMAAFAALACIGVLNFTGEDVSPAWLRPFGYTNMVLWASAAGAGLFWLALTGLLASLARGVKSGRRMLKTCLIYRLLHLIFAPIGRLFRMLFTYKPRAFRRRIIVGLILVVLLDVGMIFLLIASLIDSNGWFAVPTFFVLIAGNAFLLYKMLRFIRMLDDIIVASCGRTQVQLPPNAPRSLRLLSDNLSVTNKELETAVEQAVRTERIRSELITNVSHDLKTPLTSIISYVDLLQKCDIDDPNARQYLEVLSEKSVKLKHLIEDLIEASKISSGNVELHRVILDLGELAMQAVVETTPEFEQRDLTLVFEEPQDAPLVFADGQKTYRIMENLLNNAYKYSAEGTRVYARVYSDGDFGCFELKNISRTRLDANPQELTERFMRADKSRGETDGNGLGLSIAQDLTQMHGGKLDIAVDGDLFKATVKLPLSKEVNIYVDAPPEDPAQAPADDTPEEPTDEI